jgi:DNA-binding CsgD family transcriptional regulator
MVEIVVLIGRDGLSNKQAAAKLGITLHTLRSHIETICARIGTPGRSRETIIAFYWRHQRQIAA